MKLNSKKKQSLKKYLFSFFFFSSSILWAQNERHTEHSDILVRIQNALSYQSKDNIDSLNTILKQSNNVCIQAYGIYYDAANAYQLKSEIHQTEKIFFRMHRESTKRKTQNAY